MGANEGLYGYNRSRLDSGNREPAASVLPGKTESKLGAARSANQHSRDALRDQPMNSRLSEQALLQLRDLLVGPAQREAEERFSELLEILEAQETANRGRIQTLESDLHELSAEASVLRQDYEALGQRIERVLKVAEQEKAAVQAQFGEAARMLQEEFESKVYSLSKTVQDTLRRADSEAERAINALVQDVRSMRKETQDLLEKAETNSMSALEQRIAQWRSEIEESRASDMQNVAASLVNLGERLLTNRR
ncbi:MAG: hypothetical protein JNM45_04705 [Rhizobiales bacterium]|nr:hypothetical protein [Hyphomicrobiales bacterium]